MIIARKVYRDINQQYSLSQRLVIVKTRNQQSMLNQHPVIISIRNWVNLEVSLGGLHIPVWRPMFQTKELLKLKARKPGPIEREVKLKELGKMVRG